jgi:hypothetical protein
MDIDLLRSLDAKMLVDDVDKVERCITFRLNTDDVDDHHTVILPSGGKFENYKRAGSPVLWHHGLDPRRGFDPVGKNLTIRSYGQVRPEIRSRNQFLTDDFSQQRYEWYRDEVLTGISLRFRSPNDGDYGPPTSDEIRARPELEALRSVWRETEGRRGWVLRSWDLAEQSLTPIPSNPNAIAVSRCVAIAECCRSGMWLPDDVRTEIEARAAETKPVETPEPTETPVETPLVPLGVRVEVDGTAWRVMDGARRLASFSTAEPAEDFLRAISAETDPKQSLDYRAFISRSRHQEFEQRMTKMINEYVDLYRWGSI